jgi:hypothetical protein
MLMMTLEWDPKRRNMLVAVEAELPLPLGAADVTRKHSRGSQQERRCERPSTVARETNRPAPYHRPKKQSLARTSSSLPLHMSAGEPSDYRDSRSLRAPGG